MSAPLLSQFTTELRKRNIARPNLYYVQIVNPSSLQTSTDDLNLISMWCSNAMTPQVSIMTNDDYMEDGIRRKYAYEYDYQNLVLQFYIDQAYDIKKFFDEWKQKIVPGRRNFNYPDDYTAPKLSLYIVNMEDKVTYQYDYLNVFPKTIQSIDLSYANGTQVSQFSVEFVFTDFNVIPHKNGVAVPLNPTVNLAPQSDAEYNAEVNSRYGDVLVDFNENVRLAEIDRINTTALTIISDAAQQAAEIMASANELAESLSPEAGALVIAEAQAEADDIVADAQREADALLATLPK